MKCLMLATIAVVTSCGDDASLPIPAPTLMVDAASSSTSTPAVSASSRHPAEQPKETRTPEQINISACNDAAGQWHCGQYSKPPPKLMSSSGGTRPPIIPGSWTVPAWDIDESNSIGCAGDNLTGTSATCVGGCSGSTCPSGNGPLATPDELYARWGTYSPRLRQNVTVTELSSSTTGAHPRYWNPLIENGSLFLDQGQLGAAQQVCATTLSAVTAKNRSTPQLLKVSFTSCIGAAQHQLVVNTNPAHPSRAWIYTSAGGGAWNISQPETATAIPFTGSPTEVDSWAMNDNVTVFSPVQVNIVSIQPTFVDFNASFSNNPTLSQLIIFDPQGAGSDIIQTNGNNVLMGEVGIQRTIVMPTASDSSQMFFSNVDSNGGATSGTSNNGDFVFLGGVLGTFGNAVHSIQLLNDCILAGSWTSTGINYYGNTYIASGKTWTNLGIMKQNAGGMWGPGTYNNDGTTFYPSGANGGANTFLETGLQIDGQTKACKAQPGAGGITIACNLNLTAALLDTNAGGASGCTFVAGGGSFCNFGP